MDEKELELFREDGCLTDEGLQALRDGQLDELGRLEAAEHLSYCDKCMDRYTALLTADVLETPPRGVHGTIMTTIWVRLMQSTYGRVAVAGVMAMKPRILVLDEPAAGLDPEGRDEILSEVKEYHKKTGTTVLLVSHSMEDIAKSVSYTHLTLPTICSV